MRFGTRSIYSNQVRSCLLRHVPSLSLWGQEDAHEAISQLIDGERCSPCSQLVLMEETNVHKQVENASPRDAFQASSPWFNHCHSLLSPLTSVFSFLLRTTSTCGSCGHQTSSFQSCTSLSLPLPVHNMIILSCIIYSPYFVHSSFVITTRPHQYSVQVKKDISIASMQDLLSQVDSLHFPASFYSIQSSGTTSMLLLHLTHRHTASEWLNGMLTQGKNLICRVVPPISSNTLHLNTAMNGEAEDEKTPSVLHCFYLQVLQVGDVLSPQL